MIWGIETNFAIRTKAAAPRPVQSDGVVVPVARVELDGETARVTGAVRVFSAVGDCAEASENRRDGTRLEEGGLRVLAHIVRDGEAAEGGGTAGVDDALAGLGAIERLLFLEESSVEGCKARRCERQNADGSRSKNLH